MRSPKPQAVDSMQDLADTHTNAPITFEYMRSSGRVVARIEADGFGRQKCLDALEAFSDALADSSIKWEAHGWAKYSAGVGRMTLQAE